MGSWSDRAEDLLYDGETIEERVEVGTAAVVVTSHRVLTFTPDVEGANFQQADRPNVTGVHLRASGESKFLQQGARAALYGIVLVVAGLLLPLDSILGGVALPTSTGRLGIGGIMGLFQQMLTLMQNIDDFMRLGGALLLLFALVPFGVYLWTRERALVIDVAGDEQSLAVPNPGEDGEAIAERLETVILPAGVDSGSDGRLESLLG